MFLFKQRQRVNRLDGDVNAEMKTRRSARFRLSRHIRESYRRLRRRRQLNFPRNSPNARNNKGDRPRRQPKPYSRLNCFRRCARRNRRSPSKPEYCAIHFRYFFRYSFPLFIRFISSRNIFSRFF